MSEEWKADYCIVGAGIAGLLAASRLARTGRSVLILEQGPEYSEQERAALLAKARREFDYQEDYNDGMDAAMRTPVAGSTGKRLFGFGGTALHFGGAMVRPCAADFRVKTEFGYGRDWPITYDDLEPWLARAEWETGVAGNDDNPYAAPRPSGPYPMPAHAFSWVDRTLFGPALEKVGMQGHSVPYAVTSRTYEFDEYGKRSACAGCRYCRFCPTGARYSPDRVHGAWLKTRANVEIRNGVSVRRLETGRDGSRVVAAHLKRVADGKEFIVRAKHFVLAMGGVATPRMLLLSDGSGDHVRGIGNAGGRVGFGHSDHAASFAVMELSRHAGGMLGFPTMLCEYGHKHVKRDEESPWILFGPGVPGVMTSLVSSAVPWSLSGNRLSLARLRDAVPRLVSLFMMHELSGSGTLGLDPDEIDHFGDPIARIDLPFTDWDRSGEGRIEKLARDLGEHMGMQNLFASELASNHNHPSGSTAMGTSFDDGVCDKDLKVFGVDNLFLCSNSVFPHMGANPPTLTIAALALRLGTHLMDK